MSNEESKSFFRRFTVVLIEDRDNGWFSAQCLEWDIAVQAQGLNDVLLELQRVMKGHIAISQEQNTPPFHNLPKAPEKFWELFRKSNIQVTQIGLALPQQDTSQKPHTVLDYDARLSSRDIQLV